MDGLEVKFKDIDVPRSQDRLWSYEFDQQNQSPASYMDAGCPAWVHAFFICRAFKGHRLFQVMGCKEGFQDALDGEVVDGEGFVSNHLIFPGHDSCHMLHFFQEGIPQSHGKCPLVQRWSTVTGRHYIWRHPASLELSRFSKGLMVFTHTGPPVSGLSIMAKLLAMAED